MPKPVYLCVSALIMAAIVFSGVWFIFKNPTNLSHYTDNSQPEGYDMHLKIQGKQGISYTNYEKRSTTDTNNKWFVIFAYSDEGSDSKMNFWLDRSNTAVSQKYTVSVNPVAEYFDAYGSANGSDVRLAVQNNNDTVKKYEILGYWSPQSDPS